MSVKKFNSNFNQNLWDKFSELRLEEGKSKASINQYKVGVHALEDYIQSDFITVTTDQLDKLNELRAGKNIQHLKGFLMVCISQQWLTASKELITYLIPKDYRKLIDLLTA